MVDNRKVFKVVREMLNENMQAQFVFPKFYIYLNKSDEKHLEALSNCESYQEIMKKENLDQRLARYSQLLQKVFNGTKYIAEWYSVPHFGLFQKAMEDEIVYSALTNAEFENVDEIQKGFKSNKTSKETALKDFTGLSDSQIDFESLSK